MPFARNSATTVSLWTRSPRTVSGSRRAVSRARATASFTPKHMPKCSARMIFININFVSQSKRPRLGRGVQTNLSGLVLPDDLFELVDVFSEGFAARGREGAGGERAVVLKGFGHRHVAGLLEGADRSEEHTSELQSPM